VPYRESALHKALSALHKALTENGTVLRERGEEARAAWRLLARAMGCPTLQTASQSAQPFSRKASSCPRRSRVFVGIMVAGGGVPRAPVHPRNHDTDGAGQVAGCQCPPVRF
jgi:hypothetical protein